MSNIVDIKNVKPKNHKNNVKKDDDSIMVVVKEMLPKFVYNKTPNENLVINLSFTVIFQDRAISVVGIIKYIFDSNKKVNFDEYKTFLSNDFNTIYKNDEFSMLSKFSSHTFSSFSMSLLKQSILVEEILNELLLLDRFIFFCPTDSFVIPYAKPNKDNVEEIKGIDYVLRSNNNSAVLCRINVIVTNK